MAKTGVSKKFSFKSKSHKSLEEEKAQEMEEVDTKLLDVENKMEELKKEQSKLLARRVNLQEVPENWCNDSGNILVEVPPDDDQYWHVHSRLRRGKMGSAWISKLWHVQNRSLWTSYSFRKKKTTFDELYLWHGTSSVDPSIIYNDQKDGFTMQLAYDGLWGRGIYFSSDCCYSDRYAYTPCCTNQSERPGGIDGEREMFLAKLLVGKALCKGRNSVAEMVECKHLTAPLIDEDTGLQYNTVTGETKGSKVWIVYESGRAYPEYLVRYYTGERDSQRTPFQCREEAMRKSTKTKRILPKSEQGLPDFLTSVGLTSPDTVVWEFLDHGWVPFFAQAQQDLEAAYQNFIGNRTNGNHLIKVKGAHWTYEVDIKTMTQTNIQLKTKRDVRRYASYRPGKNSL